MIKHFKRTFEVVSFSGSIIDFLGCFLDFVGAEIFEICLFWEVLSEQAIRIFIGTALPGTVGLGKKDICIQSSGNVLMSAELCSIVECDGMNMFFKGSE